GAVDSPSGLVTVGGGVGCEQPANSKSTAMRRMPCCSASAVPASSARRQLLLDALEHLAEAIDRGAAVADHHAIADDLRPTARTIGSFAELGDLGAARRNRRRRGRELRCTRTAERRDLRRRRWWRRATDQCDRENELHGTNINEMPRERDVLHRRICDCSSPY